MDSLDLRKMQSVAVEVVKEGMKKALSPAKELEIDTKSNRNDLVTVVDKEIESYAVVTLQERTEIPVMGEEGHDVKSFDGFVWVIDPIDGTMNYVATHRDYAISLALCENGSPILAVVADVAADKIYTAIKGEGAFCNNEPISQVPPEESFTNGIIITDFKEISALPRLHQAILESRGHRRYGSAALECIEVAKGQAGAFVHLWVSPWDIAAAKLICEETGVKVSRLDGTRLDVTAKGSILAAWPKAHQELLEKLVINAF